MTFNDHWNNVKHKYTGTDYYRADELAADIWQASREAALEECEGIATQNYTCSCDEECLLQKLTAEDIAAAIRAAKGRG